MTSPKPAAAADLFARVRLLAVDIDGTLTDGFLYWGGPTIGWTQRFCVRDGEALLRLVRAGVQVVPISRNRTACARARMEGLGFDCTWVGITDKLLALEELTAKYQVPASAIAYAGDGHEDVPILRQVAVACVPADGHKDARAVAAFVTQAKGGEGAVEEICERIGQHHPEAPTQAPVP